MDIGVFIPINNNGWMLMFDDFLPGIAGKRSR
jgi:hypothetical protein